LTQKILTGALNQPKKALNFLITTIVIMISEKGKLSLDLLVGVSIFMFAFIFIAQLLPSVFAGTRSEISLGQEAYKVSVLLAETSGRWSNGTVNGTDWEDHWSDANVAFLPGLAIKPNHLSYKKIKALRDAISSNYTKVREMLGLKTPNKEYNFHVSLEMLNSTPYKRIPLRDSNGSVVLDEGPIPSGQVLRFERIVWIDELENLTNVVSFTPSSPNVTKNVTIDLTYPVNAVIVSTTDYVNPHSQAWIRVYAGPQGFGGFPSSNEVTCLNASEGLGYNDLTPLINAFLKSEGFQDGDQVTVKIKIKNFVGTVYWTDSIDFLSGRLVAKLVVEVW